MTARALSPPPWRCGAADRGCSPSAATGRASTRTSQDDRRHRHRRVAAPPPTSRRSSFSFSHHSVPTARVQGVRPGAGGLVVGGRPSSPPPRSRWAEQPPNALVRWSARCRAAPRSARRATRRAPRGSRVSIHEICSFMNTLCTGMFATCRRILGTIILDLELDSCARSTCHAFFADPLGCDRHTDTHTHRQTHRHTRAAIGGLTANRLKFAL